MPEFEAKDDPMPMPGFRDECATDPTGLLPDAPLRARRMRPVRRGPLSLRRHEQRGEACAARLRVVRPSRSRAGADIRCSTRKSPGHSS